MFHPQAWSKPCHCPCLPAQGAAAYLCTGCMGEFSAYFCCQVLYFKSRCSVIRKSEKHLGSQTVGKKHCSKENVTGMRALCMIHGQHDTWNISVMHFPQRAVVEFQENMSMNPQYLRTVPWRDTGKRIWRNDFKAVLNFCVKYSQKPDIFPCLVG